jgi:hypothetical protein
MLSHLNVEKEFRRLIRMTEPDLHMKDMEILLRCLAMLIEGNNYAPSLAKFLNHFSNSYSFALS